MGDSGRPSRGTNAENPSSEREIPHGCQVRIVTAEETLGLRTGAASRRHDAAGRPWTNVTARRVTSPRHLRGAPARPPRPATSYGQAFAVRQPASHGAANGRARPRSDRPAEGSAGSRAPAGRRSGTRAVGAGNAKDLSGPVYDLPRSGTDPLWPRRRLPAGNLPRASRRKSRPRQRGAVRSRSGLPHHAASRASPPRPPPPAMAAPRLRAPRRRRRRRLPPRRPRPGRLPQRRPDRLHRSRRPGRELRHRPRQPVRSRGRQGPSRRLPRPRPGSGRDATSPVTAAQAGSTSIATCGRTKPSPRLREPGPTPRMPRLRPPRRRLPSARRSTRRTSPGRRRPRVDSFRGRGCRGRWEGASRGFLQGSRVRT
jgi:hypothetical protein